MKKIYNVKFTLLALLMVCLFGVNEKAWGAKPYYNSGDSKWYSLYDTDEYANSGNSKNNEVKETVVPPTDQTISVDWRKDRVKVVVWYNTGFDLWIDGTSNSNRIVHSTIGERQDDWKKADGSVGTDATSVSVWFQNSTEGKGHIKNIRIPMAKHIRFANGGVGTDAITPTIPDTYVEATTDAIPVTFRSFLTNGDITISLTSGDPEVFRLGTANNTSGEITTSKDGKSYKVGANACAAAGGTANATAGGSTLGDISKYGFNVYFRPKAATTYSGTITITDGTSMATVTLSGKGILNDNAINWTPTTTGKKNWGDQVDANATATNAESGCPAITYTVESGKESYVTIADGKITFNQAGAGQSVKITATQEANYKYKKATLEKTFQIKKSQTIVWDPEKVNTNIRLTKTRDIADYTYAEPSGDRTISYSSDKTDIISVSGTVLTANKVGKANITATLAGDAEYNEVTSSKEFEVKEKEAVVFRLGEAIITDDNDDLEFTVGQTSKVITSNNTDKAIGYETTNADVAIFNTTTKRIEAKGEGDAIITLLQDVADDFQSGNRTLNITVSLNTTTITANVSEKTMDVGATYDPELTTNNNEVTMKIVSSDEDVVVYEDSVLKAKGEGTATVTFSQEKTTKWAAGSKTIDVTVNKIDPTLTITGVTSPAWNTSIEPTISSKNTDPNCAITITKVSGSDAAARIFGSSIKVYDKDGEDFIFNVSQAGNNTYNAVNKNCTIQVRKPNKHVTYNAGSPNVGKNSSQVIEFTGVPKQVQFTPSTNVITSCTFTLKWATDKNETFTEFATFSKDDAGTQQSVDIDASARALEIAFSGGLVSSAAGDFQNLTITERKEILVNGLTNNYYDFGTWEVGNQATDRAIPIEWYSVPKTTVTSSNPGVFDVLTETIDSEIDDFDNSTSITIRYHHKRVTPGTQDEATITLTSENGYSTSFKVKGKTVKKNQTLIWQDELSPIEVGTVIPNAAIAPLALNYSIISTTEEGVVKLDGTVLKAEKVGEVKLHVANEGDAMWYPVSGECTIKVTDLKVQHIRWNENFTRLTTSDADQELKATAYEYVNGEEVPITARSITYTSNNTGVVSIVNGKLHVVGVGTTTLTASLAGVDGVYEPASVTRNVKVRVKSTGCTPYVLNNAEYSLNTIETKELSLSGEPAQITFKAKGEKYWGIIPHSGPMKFAEYYGGEWHQRWSSYLSETSTGYGPIDLDRSTTKVKFYTEVGATCYHTFEEAYVTKAKYLELDDTKEKTTTSVDFNDANLGQTYVKSVVVNYSNIHDMLYVNHTNPNFRITPTEIGEGCGENSRATITIIYYAKDAIDENDVITITDNESLTATINVSASVSKSDQTITWDPDTEINTTDNVTFDATASSELDVTYVLAEGDAEVATLTEDGKLTIKTAGDIHVTASQGGSKLYNEVELEPVTIHISKVTPSVSVSPSVAAVTLPKTLSDVTLNTSEAKMVDDKGAEVAGTYAWVDGTTVLTSGNHDYSVRFTPTKDAWYNEKIFDVMVTANKRNQVITWEVENNQTLPCSAIIPLNAVLTDDYSGEVMDETLTYESSNEACAEIIEGELIIKTPGTTIITVSRAEDATYNKASITRTITFEKTTPVIETLPTANKIYQEQWLHESAITGGVVRSGERRVQGAFAWTTKDFQAMAVGTQNYDAEFIPANEDCYYRVTCKVPMTVLQIERVFTDETGDGDWNNPANWSNGFVPPVNASVDVTVSEDVTITGEANVGSITINEDVTITVEGQLTITGTTQTDNDAYANVVVKDGGELNVEGTLDVNNLIIVAALGDISGNQSANSGQVSNEDKLNINGDVYFDLALDPSGECSKGWYDFTVPFPVDVMTGITRFDNTTGEEKTIKNEVNYAIMDFSESRHVETGYGWKKFRGILQPGKCYTITIDDVDNVYRFKKTKTGEFNNQTEETLAYTDTELSRRGWNGLGNGTLKHIDLSADGIDKVQIFNHASNSYTTADMDEYTFVVGSAYFVQAPVANSVISYGEGTKDNEYLRAPRRAVANKNSEFRLKLTREDAEVEADRLYVGASNEALDSYEIGRDLTKFGTPTNSKVAQVWAKAYGMILCDIDMPLIDNVAECTIGLYAPKAGSYWLTIDKAPENATLYLTHNGEVMWDLTISPYMFDLSKGTTDGYGLRMEVKKAPAVTTGVEQTEFSGQSSARKVIIDNKVYIVTPEGKMYDIIGKGVKF